MGIRSILVATDFSDTADLAIERAEALARAHDARLLIAHVSGLEPFAAGGLSAPALPAGLESAVRAAANQRLLALGERCGARGLRVETLLETGDAVTAIAALADKEQVDLIVVGTRGLSGLRHLLLGSTAEGVVRTAACPVLTVHEGDTAGVEAPQALLLATDFSEGSHHAERPLGDLFAGRAKGIRILLLHVNPLPLLLDPVLGDLDTIPIDFDALLEPIAERLEPSAARLRSSGFRGRVHRAARRPRDGDHRDGCEREGGRDRHGYASTLGPRRTRAGQHREARRGACALPRLDRPPAATGGAHELVALPGAWGGTGAQDSHA